MTRPYGRSALRPYTRCMIDPSSPPFDTLMATYSVRSRQDRRCKLVCQLLLTAMPENNAMPLEKSG